jgi:hypothetical protein
MSYIELYELMLLLMAKFHIHRFLLNDGSVDGRNNGRGITIQVIPFDSQKPRMILHLLSTISTQSKIGIWFAEPRNKISSHCIQMGGYFDPIIIHICLPSRARAGKCAEING